MTDEIIKLLDELAKKFGVAIDWTSENVMPYLEDLFGRFITYQITVDVIWLLLMTMSIGLTIVFFKFAIKAYKSDEDNILFEQYSRSKEVTLFGGLAFIFISLFAITCLILGLVSLFEIVKLIYIPEVFMLDWLNARIG